MRQTTMEDFMPIARPAFSDTTMEIWHLNTKWVWSTLGHLQALTEYKTRAPDVIGLCETWVEKSKDLPKLPGYTSISNGLRNNCGGTGLYVREDLSCKEISPPSHRI